MVELAGQLLQKSFLLLAVPIGLLDRAASASDRAEGPAGLIGAQIGGLRIGMLLDLPGLEVEEFFVPGILQDQRLFPVADDHPIALPDFQLLHSVPLRSSTQSCRRTAVRGSFLSIFYEGQTSGEAIPFGSVRRAQ